MRRLVFSFLLAFAGCTDSGLYAAGAGGPSGPDRAELKGVDCVPVAAGESFPVKVVYAIEGGAGVDRTIVGNVVDALNSVTSQFTSPYISFAVVGYRTIATGFQGSFVRDERVAQAFARYGGFQEVGPVSHRSPLRLAQSIISGDMQTGCRGLVARTRYYVVQIILTPDTSCANPVFNAGIAQRCNAFLQQQNNEPECSACELSRVTEELRDTATRFNAGEVTVQPVYVRASPDVATRYVAAAIARAGGTELIETTPDSIERTLASLNYASLQRELVLKRLIVMNRNMLARNGEQLVDSDGDGLGDDEETALGTDPTLYDTDNDQLGDGVELRMGLNPRPGNLDTVSGCQADVDTDGDRLTDCEERVLGTDSCIADTDGDGLPDLPEVLGGTNPLLAEDLQDDDRDGLDNVAEIEAHTDPLSVDIEFQKERGYGYSIKPAERTPDGRACYDLNIYNVSLGATLARPAQDRSGLVVPRGSNDLYLFLQVGRENDPRGTGIGSLMIRRLTFSPPSTVRPKRLIEFTDDDVEVGF